MQLVAVGTIQLDIGHDGALYPCLSLGAWPNRVIRAAFRRLLRQEGPLYIRLVESPSLLLGGVIR